MIELINIRKAFAGQDILRGVDLKIEKGESLVIIGRSGCGKSVLLKHLVGLLRPDEGRIIFEGEDTSQFNETDWNRVRSRVGMLFQGAALFDSMTVGENIGFFLREHLKWKDDKIDDTVDRMLELVGLKGIAGKKPAELSGGMKKRVGLARAIAHNPEYVLYDEPTTGLDPIMADAIDRLIADLNKKLDITSVVVTHDMKSAYAIADRMAMLFEGRVVFQGTPDEIQKADDPLVQQFINGLAEGPITLN